MKHEPRNPITRPTFTNPYSTKFMSSLRQVQEVLPVPHLPPCAGAGQHFKRTRKLTGPPKPLPEAARGATITTWTVVSVADTLHNRLHFLRNSCSTQGAKPPPGTPMHGSHLLVQHGGRRSGFLPFNDAHLDDRKHPILARRPLRVIVCAHQGRGPRVRANINQSVQNGTCRRSAPRGPAPQHAPRTTARTARAPRLRTARRQPDTAANTKAQRRCFVR